METSVLLTTVYLLMYLVFKVFWEKLTVILLELLPLVANEDKAGNGQDTHNKHSTSHYRNANDCLFAQSLVS